jgi:two-component system KDP operon response regulator KdpE
MEKAMKIVIVEDDLIIVDFLKTILRVGIPNSSVSSTHLGQPGVALVEKLRPDIVILDLGLPDISGYDVVKQVRTFSSVPILILSVRAHETDVVEGLGLGADDYIVKPFRQMELLARIHALTRRQDSLDEDLSITYGPLRFGQTVQDSFLGSQAVSLTKTEGQILYQLIKRQGNIISVSALSKAIWGNDYKTANSIKVYIHRLRQKFEKDPGNPSLILNKLGSGYYLGKVS